MEGWKKEREWAEASDRLGAERSSIIFIISIICFVFRPSYSSATVIEEDKKKRKMTRPQLNFPNSNKRTVVFASFVRNNLSNLTLVHSNQLRLKYFILITEFPGCMNQSYPLFQNPASAGCVWVCVHYRSNRLHRQFTLLTVLNVWSSSRASV